MRALRVLLMIVVAGSIAAMTATPSPGAVPTPSRPAAIEPVPSLTPAATERLWNELVRRPRVQALRTADCRPVRAVFYAATDWRRLTTKLAATASPCAEYYVSVPPLAADKAQPRTDEAWRIRALGPAFHALAEINVTGWTAWVASTGNSWEAAGIEARRRMAAAGYDVSAGDTWALNELSSAVRQGTGNARANMRAFLRGLHDGDGVLPTARGAVFVVGLGQATSDLSLYQARLQDWYEDEAFWSDLGRYASDWSQELYGDVRTYAVAGASREARRDSLNEYLQHQASLASAAPAAATAARTFLAAADSPLANAAWRYDASFGWTDVDADVMQDYVSAQTYALRSAGNSRFGFAWSPRNVPALPKAEFDAQTDALLVRLAAAIADSAFTPEAACGSSWCNRDLAGAAETVAWRTFAAWKDSALAFATPPQTVAPSTASAPFTVELRTNSGSAYTAGLPVTADVTSSSPTGELSSAPGGPWTRTLSVTIGSGASQTSFYVRDTTTGTATITATTPGKTAATQTVTIGSAAPIEPTPPPVSPPPSGGGGGPAPDLAIQAGSTPSTPAVGSTLTYLVSVRNLGGPASRAVAVVRLPAQVTYAASQSDRGPGCTGTTTLTCDLDYLAGDLVANVRIETVVREPGTLTLTATASAQPADVQPANDTATVVTVVGSPAPLRPPPAAPLTLRVIGRTPASVTRRGVTADASIRFWVSEPARLLARVTPVGSTRGITLLPGTTLAGKGLTAPRPSVTGALARRGTYPLLTRLRAAQLSRGRIYLLRLTAVDSSGRQRVLAIRVRA